MSVYFPHPLSDLCEIQYHRCAHVLLSICEFCENWQSEGHTFSYWLEIKLHLCMYYESIGYTKKAMAESFYYATENTICKDIIGSPLVPFCQKCRAEYVTSVLHCEGVISYCSLQT